MLMKLTPVVNFINNFLSSFCADILLPKYYKTKLYLKKNKKLCARKMLMKVTPGRTAVHGVALVHRVEVVQSESVKIYVFTN